MKISFLFTLGISTSILKQSFNFFHVECRKQGEKERGGREGGKRGEKEEEEEEEKCLLYNMEELKDCFKIEVLIPGVKREDIFTYIEDNVLSVVVLNNNCEQFNTGKLQIHEFDTGCLQRHILLPDNADAEFTSAEYKEGMLSIYISKTQEPSKTNTQHILIY